MKNVVIAWLMASVALYVAIGVIALIFLYVPGAFTMLVIILVIAGISGLWATSDERAAERAYRAHMDKEDI